MFTQYAPTLGMLLLQAAIYVLQNRGVITPDQTMGLMGTLATLGVAGAHRMRPPKAAAVATAALLLLVGCTPAQRSMVPILSTVDAIGMGLSRAMGWCEAAGADKTTLARARKAYEDQDYATATMLVSEIAAELRRNGADVPDDAFVTLKLAEGALAAQSIQDGLRALSGTAK